MTYQESIKFSAVVRSLGYNEILVRKPSMLINSLLWGCIFNFWNSPLHVVRILSTYVSVATKAITFANHVAEIPYTEVSVDDYGNSYIILFM